MGASLNITLYIDTSFQSEVMMFSLPQTLRFRKSYAKDEKKVIMMQKESQKVFGHPRFWAPTRGAPTGVFAVGDRAPKPSAVGNARGFA
jgi:hypothetical protein